MEHKGKPVEQMSVYDRFRAGIIDKFTVPVIREKPRTKPKTEKRGKRGRQHAPRWLSHADMLMHTKRIKRNRRRNEIAKQSRRINRA